jgi:hypothetical protein
VVRLVAWTAAWQVSDAVTVQTTWVPDPLRSGAMLTTLAG